MVRDRGDLQLSGSIRPPPWLGRSPLARPTSMQSKNVIAALAVFRLSPPVFDGLMSGPDRRAFLSHAASSLASSASTSALSGYPSSRSWVTASSATLLPPMRCLVCCIDRLNPPLIRVIHGRRLERPPRSLPDLRGPEARMTAVRT